MKSVAPNAFSRTLRRFFAEYLTGVRGASQHTVLSYRDALALFLRFLADRTARPVVDLDLGDLEPDATVAFLDHLEHDRGNRIVTRNARLAALHAFARYLATQEPEWIATSQQILAVPFKRAPVPVVEYLEANEIRAMLDATDSRIPTGRRDHTLILTLFNTGARVQELLDLRPIDLRLERPQQVRLRGKGRKERFCPLWQHTADGLRSLLAESSFDDASTQRLFRNRRGEPLTRFAQRRQVALVCKLGHVPEMKLVVVPEIPGRAHRLVLAETEHSERVGTHLQP